DGAAAHVRLERLDRNARAIDRLEGLCQGAGPGVIPVGGNEEVGGGAGVGSGCSHRRGGLQIRRLGMCGGIAWDDCEKKREEGQNTTTIRRAPKRSSAHYAPAGESR